MLTPAGFMPTFLMCSERSGSNLLRCMLDAHHAIAAPMPVHLGRDLLRRAFAYGDLNDDDRWDRFTDHALSLIEAAMGDPLIDVDADELRGGPRDAVEVYRHIYASVGAMHVVIKENHAHQIAPLLLQGFSDARFLWQVRDPRDYIASCKAIGLYGSITHAIDTWLRDQEGAARLHHALGDSRVFPIRYEDLVRKPERVLPAVCAFIGVSFDGAMLDYHRTPRAKKAAEASERWKNVAKPPMREAIGRFARRLTRSERRAVEQRLGGFMRLLGYTPLERTMARRWLPAGGRLNPGERSKRAQRSALRREQLPRETEALGATIRFRY